MCRRLCLALVILGLAAAPLRAQSLAGTYSGTGTGGAATLTLAQKGNELAGTLVRGGTTFQVDAELEGNDVIGVATSAQGAVYLEGHREGGQIRMIVAPMNAQMQPDYQRAAEILFSQGGGGASAAAAPPAGRGGNPLSGGGGNPLARASDPLVGTFSGNGIAITVQKSGDGYAGTLESQGAKFPFTGQPVSGRLTGTFSAGGSTYMFEARVQGNTMSLLSDGQTHQLTRGGAGGGNPLAAASAPAADPQAGGMSTQDQQIMQILLSSPRWCYFTYNKNSGASNTEKVRFGQDGSMVVQTGGETYSSNPYGSVAGQSSGGGAYRYKVQNGALQVSADGMQWAAVPLQIYPNSNGSPIVKTGDGKEYSMCS